MKDPVRFRDGSSEAVRELLSHAPRTRIMTEVERARIVAQGVKIAAMPVATAPAATLAGFGAAKIGAGIAAVVIAGGATYAALQSPRVTPATVVEREKPTEIAMPSIEPPPPAPIATAEPVATAIETSKPVVVRPVLRKEKPKPVVIEPDGDTLAREARQLANAGKLVATNPLEALRLLEAHAMDFPRGKLGIEREVLMIDALRRAGRRQLARSRAEVLLERAKGSLYEVRVRRMLEGDKP